MTEVKYIKSQISLLQHNTIGKANLISFFSCVYHFFNCHVRFIAIYIILFVRLSLSNVSQKYLQNNINSNNSY